MTLLFDQVVRFGIVGLINTAIGLALIYAVIFFFHADPALANAVGFAAGFAISFALNRTWTFNSTTKINRSLPRSLLVAGVAYLCNLAAVVIGSRGFGANPYLIQLVGMAIYTTLLFVGYRKFAFT